MEQTTTMTQSSVKKIPILPTTLYEFEVPQDIFAPLVALCHQIPYNWENDGDVRNYADCSAAPAALALANWAEESVEEIYLDIYNKPYAHSMAVTSMWITQTKRGEYTHLHKHPWSVISGIVYLTGESGDTTFVRENPYDDTNGRMNMSHAHKHEHAHKLSLGKMLIFPSTLAHFVNTNTEDSTRHTLSFNMMPRTVYADPTVRFENWHKNNGAPH